MFQSVPPAPADAILGLSAACELDPNPEKINLSVGVYKDAAGTTPVLASVKEAEARILRAEKSKGYLGIPGAPDYTAAVQQLLFGPDGEIVQSGRAATAHTPGGTGALRVAADFLHKLFPAATVWLSEPTWPNHPAVFEAAGVAVQTYPYFDAAANALKFQEMLDAIARIPAGDVLLLHGCCHNPTGIDPSAGQWRRIAQLAGERKITPLVDFAYQGFADGIEQDAAPLRTLGEPCREMLVCNSFSKNFGLYRERVGALTLVAETAEAAAAVGSQVNNCIRTNYSNPPSHGGAIVATVLGDPRLCRQWHDEVRQMRARINDTRRLLVRTLAAQGVDRDFSFLERQRGMFSFTGLTPQQVDTLREQHSIYIVRSGRINVAGITEANVERLCRAIAAVV